MSALAAKWAMRRPDLGLRRQTHGSVTPARLDALRPDVEVDALATFCPEPVIRAQDRMRTMEPGQVMLLWADDVGVEIDIPAWCISTGNEFLGLIRDPDALRVYLRKA